MQGLVEKKQAIKTLIFLILNHAHLSIYFSKNGDDIALKDRGLTSIVSDFLSLTPRRWSCPHGSVFFVFLPSYRCEQKVLAAQAGNCLLV